MKRLLALLIPVMMLIAGSCNNISSAARVTAAPVAESSSATVESTEYEPVVSSVSQETTKPVSSEPEGQKAMQIKVTDGGHTVVFQLNDTPQAAILYGLLPLDVPVEDYSDNEKIFYPPEEIDAAGGIEGSGDCGSLALFSPWGDVIMYYGPFEAYPGLFLLGEAVEGSDQICDLTGIIHIEALEE